MIEDVRHRLFVLSLLTHWQERITITAPAKTLADKFRPKCRGRLYTRLGVRVGWPIGHRPQTEVALKVGSAGTYSTTQGPGASAKVRSQPYRLAADLHIRPTCLHENGPLGDGPKSAVNIGRDGGIRTHDPLTPSQVRYQTALHPDA